MNNHSHPTDQDLRLDHALSDPPPAVLDAVRQFPGDFLVLGAGGKMGTTLAFMLRRALDAVDRSRSTVTAVSRFSQAAARARLEAGGVRTISCDLADPDATAALPDAAHVFFLAGQKFGTAAAPEATWVQNTIVPAVVARRFAAARIVAFSTGCVYPFMPVTGPGAAESEPCAFLGEYASSCVGRERVFTHFSREAGTPVLLLRLNYAVEYRYGVLVDIGLQVRDGQPVDLSTGWFNCIWQQDACALALRSLSLAASPPRLLNVTGLEKLSVRAVATEFGQRFGRAPVFTGTEAPTAWLADARECARLLGPPETSTATMIARVADHLRAGGPLLGKPTHFETRSGQF